MTAPTHPGDLAVITSEIDRMLAAACIVALAIVMQFYHPHGWERWIGVVFWIVVAMAAIDYVRTLLNLRK